MCEGDLQLNFSGFKFPWWEGCLLSVRNKDCTMWETIKFEGHLKTKLAEGCINLPATDPVLKQGQ